MRCNNSSLALFVFSRNGKKSGLCKFVNLLISSKNNEQKLQLLVYNIRRLEKLEHRVYKGVSNLFTVYTLKVLD